MSYLELLSLKVLRQKIFDICLLGEAKLICCFTGQASQKSGSVGQQKNKNKRYILITKARKLLIKLGKSWQKYENDKWMTQIWLIAG